VTAGEPDAAREEGQVFEEVAEDMKHHLGREHAERCLRVRQRGGGTVATTTTVSLHNATITGACDVHVVFLLLALLRHDAVLHEDAVGDLNPLPLKLRVADQLCRGLAFPLDGVRLRTAATDRCRALSFGGFFTISI
jgi:hypothetical protein